MISNYVELTPEGVFILSPSLYFSFQEKLESGEISARYVFSELDMIVLKFNRIDPWENKRIVKPCGE